MSEATGDVVRSPPHRTRWHARRAALARRRPAHPPSLLALSLTSFMAAATGVAHANLMHRHRNPTSPHPPVLSCADVRSVCVQRALVIYHEQETDVLHDVSAYRATPPLSPQLSPSRPPFDGQPARPSSDSFQAVYLRPSSPLTSPKGHSPLTSPEGQPTDPTDPAGEERDPSLSPWPRPTLPDGPPSSADNGGESSAPAAPAMPPWPTGSESAELSPSHGVGSLPPYSAVISPRPTLTPPLSGWVTLKKAGKVLVSSHVRLAMTERSRNTALWRRRQTDDKLQHNDVLSVETAMLDVRAQQQHVRRAQGITRTSPRSYSLPVSHAPHAGHWHRLRLRWGQSRALALEGEAARSSQGLLLSRQGRPVPAACTPPWSSDASPRIPLRPHCHSGASPPLNDRSRCECSPLARRRWLGGTRGV